MAVAGHDIMAKLTETDIDFIKDHKLRFYEWVFLFEKDGRTLSYSVVEPSPVASFYDTYTAPNGGSIVRHCIRIEDAWQFIQDEENLSFDEMNKIVDYLKKHPEKLEETIHFRDLLKEIDFKEQIEETINGN